MSRWARLTLTLTVLAAVAVVTVSLVVGSIGSAPRAMVDVTVGPGDTLWSIATQAAPDRDPRDVIEEIKALNDVPGSVLPVGVVLRVPRLPGSAVPSRWPACCEQAVPRRPPGPVESQIRAPTRGQDLHAGVWRSTVNPYIWYLHRCKISTGCATKVGELSTGQCSCPPVVHIGIHIGRQFGSSASVHLGNH